MAYLCVLLVSVAAQPLGCLTVLDEWPRRLKRGGARNGFMLPLGLKQSEVGGRMRFRAGGGLMEICGPKISRFLFLSFRVNAGVPACG